MSRWLLGIILLVVLFDPPKEYTARKRDKGRQVFSPANGFLAEFFAFFAIAAYSFFSLKSTTPHIVLTHRYACIWLTLPYNPSHQRYFHIHFIHPYRPPASHRTRLVDQILIIYLCCHIISILFPCIGTYYNILPLSAVVVALL